MSRSGALDRIDVLLSTITDPGGTSGIIGDARPRVLDPESDGRLADSRRYRLYNDHHGPGVFQTPGIGGCQGKHRIRTLGRDGRG
jgi:hypothetical protein